MNVADRRRAEPGGRALAFVARSSAGGPSRAWGRAFAAPRGEVVHLAPGLQRALARGSSPPIAASFAAHSSQ